MADLFVISTLMERHSFSFVFIYILLVAYIMDLISTKKPETSE